MKNPSTDQESASGENDWMVRSHIQTLALLAVTAFRLYLCSEIRTVFAFISGVGGLVLFGPVVLTFTIVVLEIGSARIRATEPMLLL